MRRFRLVLTLALTCAALVVGGLLLATLVLWHSGRQSAAAERRAATENALDVDSFARTVVKLSNGPSGPSAPALDRAAGPLFLHYAVVRAGQASTSIAVNATASFPGLLGGGLRHDCSIITFQGLGTPAADYVVVPQPDCRLVDQQLTAKVPTIGPSH